MKVDAGDFNHRLIMMGITGLLEDGKEVNDITDLVARITEQVKHGLQTEQEQLSI